MKTSFIPPLKALIMAVVLAGAPVGKINAAETEKPVAQPPRREEPRWTDAGEAEDRARLMEMEVRELRKQGNHDEAARMERQIAELRQKLAAGRERAPGEGLRPLPPREGMRPDSPAFQERRRQQVRAAIEQLRAAGLPDLAEHVEREATAKLGELPKTGPGIEGRPMAEGGQAERLERLEGEVRDLRQQLRMMQKRLMPPER